LSNLQSYKTVAPLSAGARFIRGFTRIGAVAVVVIVLIGVVVSYNIAKSEYNAKKATFDSADCVARKARAGYTFKAKYYNRFILDYEAAGCSEVGVFGQDVDAIIDIADRGEPSFIAQGLPLLGGGLLATGLCAVAAYLGFWAIGWLCAGFTRDPP
jgi:hypothetical protein